MPSHKIPAPREDLTYRLIGAAMAIHRQIGPGQEEAVYQRALEEHLAEDGIAFKAKTQWPVYDGDRLLGFYIPDFIVENRVIVEITAFSTLVAKTMAQVVAHLNHTHLPTGLLINFNVRRLRDGIKRFVL